MSTEVARERMEEEPEPGEEAAVARFRQTEEEWDNLAEITAEFQGKNLAYFLTAPVLNVL